MIEKIGCIADKRVRAQELKKYLVRSLKFIDLEKKFEPVDLIVVCGGDGTLLHSIHNFMDYETPFYGINVGNVGFLMNDNTVLEKRNKKNILDTFKHLKSVSINPLKMVVENVEGEKSSAVAINEVSILRQTHQTAHLEITINGIVEMKQLIADGLLISTPAGSTAYNLSAGGPILPLNANLLALTPMSPFRPRRWRGALLPETANINIRVQSAAQRPVNAVADFIEFKDAKKIDISIIKNKVIKLMFDKYKTLEDRITKEQFST